MGVQAGGGEPGDRTARGPRRRNEQRNIERAGGRTMDGEDALTAAPVGDEPVAETTTDESDDRRVDAAATGGDQAAGDGERRGRGAGVVAGAIGTTIAMVRDTNGTSSPPRWRPRGSRWGRTASRSRHARCRRVHGERHGQPSALDR